MVIQRWQTLLLLVAAVMMGLFSFCSLGQIQGAELTVNYTALGMTVVGDGATYMSTPYLFVISILSMLLALIAIFRFKAPKVQRKICRIDLLLVAATIVTAWLTERYAEVSGATEGIGWSSIVIAPFVALVSLICAIRCISSDIRKLSGYERLR